VREMIHSRQVTAVHDLSDGGLASAVIEMALAGNHGLELNAMTHEALFGEDQARYALTCRHWSADGLLAAAKSAGVPATRIGVVTAEPTATLGSVSIPLPDLRTAHETWFPAYMAGEL